MKIDKETVRHAALLSRLSLDEDELSGYSSRLASVVTYISKLNEVNTENVHCIWFTNESAARANKSLQIGIYVLK